MLVVVLHLIGSHEDSNLWIHFLSPGTPIRPYYTGISQFAFMGFIGVEIFFSISGYIIFVSAERSRSALDFFERRLLRILPALWLSAIAGTAVLFAFHVYPTRDIVSMLVNSAFLMPFGPYTDNVVWTIVVEMAFYLGTALSITVLGRSRLIYFAYALILASTIYWLSITLLPSLSENRLLLQLSRRLLLEHGAFFGIGMLLAPRTAGDGEKHISRFFAALSIIPIYLQIRESTLIVYDGMGHEGATHDAWKPFAIYMVALVLIYLSTFLAEKKYLRGDFSTLRKIGLMTYPIYLFHFTFGNLIFGLLESYTGFPQYVNTILSIVGVLLLSYVVVEYLEGRVRNMIKPFLSWLFAYILVVVKFADQKLGGERLTNAE